MSDNFSSHWHLDTWEFSDWEYLGMQHGIKIPTLLGEKPLAVS